MAMNSSVTGSADHAAGRQQPPGNFVLADQGLHRHGQRAHVWPASTEAYRYSFQEVMKM